MRNGADNQSAIQMNPHSNKQNGWNARLNSQLPPGTTRQDQSIQFVQGNGKKNRSREAPAASKPTVTLVPIKRNQFES